eukprot:12328130-Ditylum_brightwellii.AAC.1
MKGTHLASLNNINYDDEVKKDITSFWSPLFNSNKKPKKQRAWITLSALLNIPPKPDDDPSRSLALPLSYSCSSSNDDDDGDGVKKWVQDRGPLVPDGVVDYIIEIQQQSSSLQYFPFYGHATKHLDEVNAMYVKQSQKDEKVSKDHDTKKKKKAQKEKEEEEKFLQRVMDGWTDIKNKTSSSSSFSLQRSTPPTTFARPTATFTYDWRRPLHELADELHTFVETKFPDTPVQVCAHSMGGLLTFVNMRKYPEKYKPGAVLVGVPFGTGIQYLQDLHRGYYTELDRCRQFTPKDQFTMSSHWSFFPINEEELDDLFLDVSHHFPSSSTDATENRKDGDKTTVSSTPPPTFIPDTSSIGNPGTTFNKNPIDGKPIPIDFYNPQDWQDNEFGIFDKSQNSFTEFELEEYKNHMKIQLNNAKEWRTKRLEFVTRNSYEEDCFPSLVVCASDKVPTVNQILRRKRREVSENDKNANKEVKKKEDTKGVVQQRQNPWEYDYVSGRSVEGDGRIDYVKAFPPIHSSKYKTVPLDSMHAKQMCWEESGGSWGCIWEEVVNQIRGYEKSVASEKEKEEDDTKKLQNKKRRMLSVPMS